MDQNNLTASVSTADAADGGSITIAHGGGSNTPLIIGDATTNGTAAALTTGSETISPTFEVPIGNDGIYTQGNITIITTPGETATTETPTTETPTTETPIAPMIISLAMMEMINSLVAPAMIILKEMLVMTLFLEKVGAIASWEGMGAIGYWVIRATIIYWVI